MRPSTIVWSTSVFRISALRHAQDVLREHGQVGELARLDRTALVLLEGAVGRGQRVRAERLLARHPLVGVEALGGLARLRPARDRGVEVLDRVHVLDGHVGAVDDRGAARRAASARRRAPSFTRAMPIRLAAQGRSEVQWMPCIEAITPSFAKRGMSCSSRIWACSIAEARVLHLRVLREGLLELVEHHAVGAVADGVDVHLEAVLEAVAGAAEDRLGRRREEAGVLRVVVVGLEQRRAARAHGAVGHELHGADRQEAAAEADLGLVEPPQQVVARAPSRTGAGPSLPACAYSLKSATSSRAGARVVEARDPLAQALLAGRDRGRARAARRSSAGL